MAVTALTPTAEATAGEKPAQQPEPLQCWWRTSASAVRIGEVFSVVLTCGALETDRSSVVVEQAKLDPSALQLPPFEVLGGTHAPDLRSDSRRFFQYQYNVRLINDQLFDKDVPLPELSLTYRVRTKSESGELVQGTEQTHALPKQSMRIASVVPDDAADIRDALPSTFADVESASFRADLLATGGGVASALGGLFILFAAARLASTRRTDDPVVQRSLTDGAILRAVRRELGAIRRAREQDGWTPPLLERALAAARIVAGYALERPATQRRSEDEAPEGPEGTLRLTPRWAINGDRVLISGSVTPQTIARELANRSRRSESARHRLEKLQQTLVAFTRARYAEATAADETELDGTFSASEEVVRRLAVEHTWWMKRLKALGRRPRQGQRRWLH